MMDLKLEAHIFKDPIVEKVDAIREKLAAKFNYDLKAMFDDIKKREKRSGRKLVSFAKKKKKTA